jgi:8-oxo-dGTP pyrophosphatase MutT (NUDIX family)
VVAGSTTGEIEVMLIEGINSPGQWSFPAGSLDPGEEVSVCAVRETEEESGVQGVRGCFLGMFQSDRKKGKNGGSRSYFFALHVHTVIDEDSDRWKDPDSAWESDGWRNRGWFTTTDARPKLKKGQEAVLDALLRCDTTSLPAWQKLLSALSISATQHYSGQKVSLINSVSGAC